MKTTLLVLFLTIALGTTFATTTDELTLTSGGVTATITDYNGSTGGTCSGGGCADMNSIGGVYDTNGASGTMGVASNATTFNGWTISGITGVSRSPGLMPQGLDISAFTAACSLTGGCAELDVSLSDVNFAIPIGIGGFSTFYSATVTGNGTTTEEAWFSNLNTLFAQTNLIGSVGPIGSPGGSGSASGGSIAAVPNYSLTLEQIFTAGTGTVSYSVDGNITAVPEPMSLLLLGGCLLVVGRKLAARML